MRRLLSLLVPAALIAAGCNGGPPSAASRGTATATTAAAPAPTPAPAAPGLPPATREGGAVSRSPAGDALYVADEDHGVVRRVPLPVDASAPVVTVPVPGLPAQVLALADRVLVTVRSEGGVPAAAPPKEAAAPGAASATPKGKGAPPAATSRAPAAPTGPGLLLVLRPDPAGGLVETGRVALPADAWGLAVTPDGRTALVSSAWTHQVSAIDLASMKKLWSIDVPREPRAIVVRPDGAGAYVTHLVGGRVTRIDDLAGTPKAHAVDLPPSPLRSPSGKTLDGTLAYAAVLSPGGGRLFVPRHAIGALGEAAWFGAATVDVLLTADDTPLAPKRDVGLPRAESEIVHAAFVNESQGSFPRIGQAPFAEPRAIVYRRTTDTVLVASEGTNRVVEFDARTVDPTMFVRGSIAVGADRDSLIPVARSCGAPSGLALSADDATLWVWCRTTDDLVAVRLDKTADKVGLLHLADDLLGEADARGRRIFYDATDGITSGGVACAGCHPEGRDDGHVWHEKTFNTRSGEGHNFLGDEDQAPLEKTKSVGYARQTPMLAGRVAASGPYGWHAESADLEARLEAGFSLHRWGPLDPPYGKGELIGRAQYLAPFLRHGLVPPPRDVHPETPEEARGRAIFTSNEARCSRCHVPETEYTDRIAYPLMPPLPPLPGFEDEKDQPAFKTPSLFYVGGTPPYFHDGRAATLEALIDGDNDRMGHTTHLSREDRAALVAFLRTL